MRAITRSLVMTLTLLTVQFIAGPAQAHLTDPAHAEWTAGFEQSSEVRVVSPGGFFQTDTVRGRFRASEPFDGIKVAPRTYDLTFPPDFTINTTYFSSSAGYTGDCTVSKNTVHCESGIDFVEATHDDILVFSGNAGQLPDGVYQISMTSTISVQSSVVGEPPKTYTDTDTMPIEVRQQRTSDIASTGPSDKQTLRPGVPVKYNVHVRNFGPETARDVVLSLDVEGAAVASNTSGCDSRAGFVVSCSWPALVPGASKTVEVVVTPDVGFPEVRMSGLLNSWEIDPKPDNNHWTFTARVR